MLLKRLTEASGVSGNEKEVRDIIIEEIKEYVDNIQVDKIGNVIAYKRGKKDSPRLMITAHMDEVGFIITDINDSGLLKFTTVGGIDHRILVSKSVKVGKKQIPGVIGAKPIHLQKKGERLKTLSLDQLYIDIGVNSKEEAEDLVSIGDYITFYSEYVGFGNDLIKAKALDNRVGCNLLIDLLKSNTDLSFYAVFTVMEEIGLVGAGPAAYTVEPDISIILEGTLCSDGPDTEEHLIPTKLKQGPAISLLDRTTLFNIDFRKYIVNIAEKNGIPYQFRKTSFGGNDSGKIHQAKSGSTTATISVPCRYIHSPISVMAKEDYKNTCKLLKSILSEIEKGDF
ncbi:MAG: M42 family metallopeptidase [Clostridiaceae bacterium]|nr:M42 family metallopeptidase [Clostridiaceae bacterium]MBW4859922.1 M42 family metallopeptidase [Clostridiaceae bacterium]MBW4869648.1 M42 family metallopeptidase [Clostridiaceae bacterium]